MVKNVEFMETNEEVPHRSSLLAVADSVSPRACPRLIREKRIHLQRPLFHIYDSAEGNGNLQNGKQEDKQAMHNPLIVGKTPSKSNASCFLREAGMQVLSLWLRCWRVNSFTVR